MKHLKSIKVIACVLAVFFVSGNSYANDITFYEEYIPPVNQGNEVIDSIGDPFHYIGEDLYFDDILISQKIPHNCDDYWICDGNYCVYDEVVKPYDYDEATESNGDTDNFGISPINQGTKVIDSIYDHFHYIGEDLYLDDILVMQKIPHNCDDYWVCDGDYCIHDEVVKPYDYNWTIESNENIDTFAVAPPSGAACNSCDNGTVSITINEVDNQAQSLGHVTPEYPKHVDKVGAIVVYRIYRCNSCSYYSNQMYTSTPYTKCPYKP